MDLEPDVSISTEDTCVNVLLEPEAIPTPTVGLWTSARTIRVESTPSATMKDPPTDVNALRDSRAIQLNNA